MTVPGGAPLAVRRRHHGERAGHPPPPRRAHLDDAPAARRLPRPRRAARGADRLRAGDLRPVRLRRRHAGRCAAAIDTTRIRLSAPRGRGAASASGWSTPCEARRGVRGGLRATGARPARHAGPAARLGHAAAARPAGLARRRGRAAVRAGRGGRRGARVRPLLGHARLEPGGTGRAPSTCGTSRRSTRWRTRRCGASSPRIDLTATVAFRNRPVDDPLTAPGLRHPPLPARPARLPAPAAGRRGRGAGGPYVRRAGRRGARRRGRLLPLERGALAADRRHEGRGLRADRGPGRIWPCPSGSWAPPTSAGRRCARWPAPGWCANCGPGALRGDLRGLPRRPGALAAARLLERPAPKGGQACGGWQVGHQKRLRAASGSVRTGVPQTRQGRPARR